MRLPANIQQGLVAWVARRPYRSDDGRVVSCDGNLWWRGTLLAAHGCPDSGIPPRVWRSKVEVRLRSALEAEVLRLFPGAVVETAP